MDTIAATVRDRLVALYSTTFANRTSPIELEDELDEVTVVALIIVCNRSTTALAVFGVIEVICMKENTSYRGKMLCSKIMISTRAHIIV